MSVGEEIRIMEQRFVEKFREEMRRDNIHPSSWPYWAVEREEEKKVTTTKGGRHGH